MTQKYITFQYNNGGDIVNFERWPHKSAKVVQRNILKLLKESPLFKLANTARLVCYNNDGEKVWELSHKEIMEIIGKQTPARR